MGFRVIQVLHAKEPEQKVELATLAAPVVTAAAVSPGAIELSWQPVDGANEYQIFEYVKDTGLLRMLERVHRPRW